MTKFRHDFLFMSFPVLPTRNWPFVSRQTIYIFQTKGLSKPVRFSESTDLINTKMYFFHYWPKLHIGIYWINLHSQNIMNIFTQHEAKKIRSTQDLWRCPVVSCKEAVAPNLFKPSKLQAPSCCPCLYSWLAKNTTGIEKPTGIAISVLLVICPYLSLVYLLSNYTNL